jgi:hypothetical protein
MSVDDAADELALLLAYEYAREWPWPAILFDSDIARAICASDAASERAGSPYAAAALYSSSAILPKLRGTVGEKWR